MLLPLLVRPTGASAVAAGAAAVAAVVAADAAVVAAVAADVVVVVFLLAAGASAATKGASIFRLQCAKTRLSLVLLLPLMVFAIVVVSSSP